MNMGPFMRKMIGVNIIEEVKDLLKPEQRDPVDA
jgi:hypothetical protein